MDNSDFSEVIDQLVAGIKKEVLVKHEDFSKFHRAWLKHPRHGEIVGKAQKGGDIIYHYESEL